MSYNFISISVTCDGDPKEDFENCFGLVWFGLIAHQPL